MQTNPEQWAVEVREVETVTGDFGTEPGTPFYRIEIGGYCADFDCREGAQNFANAIQAAFAEREARLVGAECKAVVDWLRTASGDWPLATAHAEILADAIERGDPLAALKDRTHG